MIEYLLNMRSIICQNTKFRIELTPVKPEISPKPSVNMFFKTLADCEQKDFSDHSSINQY
ncbi:hypothetical protein DFO79_104131 [Pseudidiomarina tainanensis]|uniref:Uncharacterized protein n=2 Tax=Pseudidiomarina TaxID=2800384 RepID=A0A368V0E2_9GAMM|nr:hypothetical protein DET45_104111 [Pseudidiomarina maritima]RBP91986.1 hypothetical protein DFO81_103111 [Pseudidiomarina tainanensis]RCW33750.1 hypothetical protein DFO79_104131 [Pseudidiomarina tainanensis]